MKRRRPGNDSGLITCRTLFNLLNELTKYSERVTSTAVSIAFDKLNRGKKSALMCFLVAMVTK